MRFRTALLVVAVTGFVSLSFEILWVRVFSVAAAGAPWVFGRVLAAFLIGLAQGAAASRRFAGAATDRGGRRALRVIAASIAASTILSYLVVPGLGWAAAAGIWQAGFVLVAAAAFLLGVVLPLVSHLGIAPDDAVGARMSYLYLASIVGSAAGSLTTGLVLTDVWSTPRIGLALAMAGVATAGGLLYAAERGAMGTVRAAGVAVAASVAIGLVLATTAQATAARLYERLSYRQDADTMPPFTEVSETRAGVVTVARDGTVYGGGAYDGVIALDLVRDPNLLVRAYALAAMHPRPAHVLQIGVATGAWTRVLASLPGVEAVTAVEINRGYLPLIARHAEVRPVLRDPRVHLVIDDARRWLARHPGERFDAIVMNTTWHWRAHSADLLSREFLALARAHLRPGGILYYNTTWSPDVVKTALATFPYVLRCVNFIAVSETPIAFDGARWSALLRGLRRDDGTPVFRAGDPVAAARLRELETFGRSLDGPPRAYGLESGPSLAARVRDAHVVTDDNMWVEWRAAPPMALP